MLKLSKKGRLRPDRGQAPGGSRRGGDLAARPRSSHGLRDFGPAKLAKVLQKLAKNGLVVSRHGSGGGYQLARAPKEISAFEVINAIDGPLTITSCVTTHGECEQATTCTVREPLRRVNESILQILKAVSISQMTDDSREHELVGLPS